MSGFFKIFLGQLLKIVLVTIAIGLGLYFAFPVASWLNPQQQNEMPSQWLFLLFGLMGFLLGVAGIFLVEFRGRLTGLSFLSEFLLMTVAMIFFATITYLGLALTTFGLSATKPQENDPHGFVAMPIFFAGAILSIGLGFLISALLTALWKYRCGGLSIK